MRDGFKHYRRTYSLKEVRWGFAVLAVLAGVLAWVVYRGQHPDPEIYGDPTLIGSANAAPAQVTVGDRGEVPEGLAVEGWVEGQVSSFEPDNLYEKINGRADYFLAFGFKRLVFVPLRAADDESVTVDVEVYDLNLPANAIGAFNGERKEGSPEKTESGFSHLGRNALFLAAGRYYVRAIGSDESAVVRAQLEHLLARLAADLAPAAKLPWAFDVFVDTLGFEASQVSYTAENAFSFGFASDVYSVRLDDDTELFIAVRATDADATELAAAFVEGFSKLGAVNEDVAGATWVQDRYLNSFATAVSTERFVVGVRSAPTAESATASLARLRTAIKGLDAATRERAVPAAPPKTAPDDEGDEY